MTFTKLAIIQLKDFTSKNGKAEMLEGQIIKLTFTQEHITLTKEGVMCGWQMAINLDPNRSCKILLVTATNSLLDEEARIAAFEEKDKWPKVAMVIHDTGQLLMAKVSINRLMTKTNTEVFSCENGALTWLNE